MHNFTQKYCMLGNVCLIDVGRKRMLLISGRVRVRIRERMLKMTLPINIGMVQKKNL